MMSSFVDNKSHKLLFILQGFLYGVSYYVNKEYLLVFPSIQVGKRCAPKHRHALVCVL